jgi:hypothetical protein
MTQTLANGRRSLSYGSVGSMEILSAAHKETDGVVAPEVAPHTIAMVRLADVRLF